MVVQRVTQAKVEVGGLVVGSIGQGLCVFLGVGAGDTEADAGYLAQKLVGLRIFADEAGRFDRSIRDAKGEVLVVSQFTLYGDVRHGRRPSFSEAAPPAQARELYERFVEEVRAQGVPVQTGEFGAHMTVSLVNDGPVTILAESVPTKSS